MDVRAGTSAQSRPERRSARRASGRLEWAHKRGRGGAPAAAAGAGAGAGAGRGPRIGLVLGAGGLVGIAYHSGVLRALEVEAGFVPAQADLLVGTSAGSVVSAYLRSGWTTDDFWRVALGTHPLYESICSPDPAEARRDLMTPAYHSPVELVRRAVGSAMVAGRCLAHVNVRIPRRLTTVFPSGLYEMTAGHRRFRQELPASWPARRLFLVAMDLTNGRRVVFGRPGSPAVGVPDAVLASCAIPGVYEPVQVDGMMLVDGGAHSSTNLDLAADAGCDVVVAIAPMAYDKADPPSTLTQVVRRAPIRAMTHELAMAQAAGAEVVTFSPSAEEVNLHGYNMMRPEGLEEVARAAYDVTARAVRHGAARVLEAVVAAV
ncbi:MAG TPA: patatin-like phospholipase family protein [Acidimicrobiales bacterium]|nr:patatin-like phospholipase family protein [Acidimicrobiales bacterium]